MTNLGNIQLGDLIKVEKNSTKEVIGEFEVRFATPDKIACEINFADHSDLGMEFIWFLRENGHSHKYDLIASPATSHTPKDVHAEFKTFWTKDLDKEKERTPACCELLSSEEEEKNPPVVDKAFAALGLNRLLDKKNDIKQIARMGIEEMQARADFHRRMAKMGGGYFHSARNKEDQKLHLELTETKIAEVYEELIWRRQSEQTKTNETS